MKLRISPPYILPVITGVRRLDNAQESFDGLQFVHHAYSEAAG